MRRRLCYTPLPCQHIAHPQEKRHISQKFILYSTTRSLVGVSCCTKNFLSVVIKGTTFLRYLTIPNKRRGEVNLSHSPTSSNIFIIKSFTLLCPFFILASKAKCYNFMLQQNHVNFLLPLL